VGCGVKLIYYMQKRFVCWNIGHRFTVMCKADVAFGVDHTVERHTSQLEQVDFLAVNSSNRMVRIGQADKGDPLLLPVLPKDRLGVRSDRQDLRAAACELFISIPQTRQLRAAVRSHKTAQEGKHDRPTAKVG
jgi:hypothetical protein